METGLTRKTYSRFRLHNYILSNLFYKNHQILTHLKQQQQQKKFIIIDHLLHRIYFNSTFHLYLWSSETSTFLCI